MSPASCTLSRCDRDIRWDNGVRGPRTRKRGRISSPTNPSMFGGLRGYLEHDLAHPATCFHEVEGRGGFLEREGLVYLRTQSVLGVEVEHRAELLGGAHRRPEHVDLLERYTNGHRLRRRACRSPEDDDPASRLGQRDEGVEGLAADVVEREVDASGHALELPGPVLRVVVDTPFHTELLGPFDLLVAPRGNEDAGAQSTGDLDYKCRHPAADTGHEYGLAFSDPAAR